MLPIAAWQFGSAGMLAWGLAAAVPVLIHLWSRRKRRQEPWAAMTFLLAAVRQNSRRIQLQQWVLLAIRITILVLFAVALADLRFSGTDNQPISAASLQHVLLVIDASYSMDCRAVDQSRFEIAKQRARQLITHGQPGDAYSLILMAEPPHVVISEPTTDIQSVLREIDALELLHAGADLPPTLAAIERIVTTASSTEKEQPLQHRVCIFSDAQQTTWKDVNTAVCRELLTRLGALASLELFDVGQDGSGNLAVAELNIDPPLAAAGSEVQIRTAIDSFAREDRPNQRIAVSVDGTPVAEKRLDCPAGGRASLSLPYRFDSLGEHIIEVHLADDVLPLDNRRWLSVPVRAAIRVMLIGSRPHDTRQAALALAPQTSSARNYIETIEAAESRLLEEDLAQYDGVVLCNIGRFTRAEAAALHRFVSGGGGLIVFLGDQVQIDNYNELLAGDGKLRTLPAKLLEVAPSSDSSFDPLDYRHPIVSPFQGFPKSGLLTTPTWKYVRLSPRTGASVALGFSGGDPAIVEDRVGRGRCFLVATAASPQSLDRGVDPPRPWTALSFWPSFPPLMQEMLRLAVTGRAADRNIAVGEELQARVAAAASETAVTLSGPGGFAERFPIVFDAGEAHWTSSRLQRSGVYEARLGGAVQRFAVNLNCQESDLSRLDAALLPSQLHARSDMRVGDDRALAGGASQYFRWFLAGVLLLLVVEPCLAWQFAKDRR